MSETNPSLLLMQPEGSAPPYISFLKYVGLVGLFGLLAGLIFSRIPIAVPALAFGTAFFWLCYNRPVPAISMFLFCLVAIPVYLRLPPIGPLPPPPIAITMLLALLGAGVLAKLAGQDAPKWGKAGRYLFVAYSCWGMVMLLSLIDGRTGSESINMWVKAVAFPIAVIAILTKALRTSSDVDLAYKALLGSALAISAYGVWEYQAGQNWLMDTFMAEGTKEWSADDFSALASAGESYRSFSVFTQPIEFATCVGMIYPYALVRMGLAKSFRQRIAYGILAVMCLAGIASSFSRMPLAAALLGAVLVSIIIKPLRIWLAAGVAAGAIGIVSAWPWIGPLIASRLKDADNLTIRVKLWEAAVAIFSDNPLLGVGIGNYPQYHMEAIRNYQIGPFDEFSGTGIDRISVAESTYFQMAAESGVFGLATFAVMIAAFFLLVYRGFRLSTSDYQKGLYVAVGLGGFNYMTNSLTITAYTHFTSTMLLFGVFFSFAIILDRELSRSKSNAAIHAHTENP